MDINKHIINIKTGKPLKRATSDFSKEELEAAKVPKEISNQKLISLLTNQIDSDTMDDEKFKKISATQDDLRQYFFSTLDTIKKEHPVAEINEDLLPKQTVGNVIMNAIINYMDDGKKETGFYINLIAQSVLDAQNHPRDIQFKKKVADVLEKALDQFSGKIITKKVKGKDGVERDEEVATGGILP
jgi:hypothetical protein